MSHERTASENVNDCPFILSVEVGTRDSVESYQPLILLDEVCTTTASKYTQVPFNQQRTQQRRRCMGVSHNLKCAAPDNAILLLVLHSAKTWRSLNVSSSSRSCPVKKPCDSHLSVFVPVKSCTIQSSRTQPHTPLPLLK